MAWTIPEFRELVADALDSYTQRDGAADDERIRGIQHGDDYLVVQLVDGNVFRLTVDREDG